MSTILLAYAIIHVICAVLSYGWMMAYSCRAYPLCARDQRWSYLSIYGLVSAAVGPVALASTLWCLFSSFESRPGFKHGFMLWPRDTA